MKPACLLLLAALTAMLYLRARIRARRIRQRRIPVGSEDELHLVPIRPE